MSISPARFKAFVRKRIEELIRGREKEIEKAIRAGDSEKIDRIAGEVNSLRIGGKLVGPGDLEVGTAIYVEDFLKGPSSKEYLLKAREMVLSGGYVPEFFFAGAATRLGLGPMYFLDPQDIADAVLGRPSGLGKKQEESIRRKLSGLGQDLRGEIVAELEKASRTSGAPAGWGPPSGGSQVPEALRRGLNVPELREGAHSAGRSPGRMGLGQRQLVRYAARLSSLAGESNSKLALKALGKAAIIIHVNEEICDSVPEDLKAHDFYGFSRENTFILVQPAFPGYVLKEGRLYEDSESPILPLGHGHATLQLVQKGAAFSLDRGGRKKYIQGNLLSCLKARGARIVGAHRINDITRLTDDVIDIGRLAFCLYLVEKGHHVIVELVSNPTNQKGGNWVRLKTGGQEFLVEGMNMKSPGLAAFLESLMNPPYNAFRNLYDIPGFSRGLRMKGLPFFLRHKGGWLYLESATGDITQYPEMRPAAIRKDEEEVIHDFKDVVNLPDAIRML